MTINADLRVSREFFSGIAIKDVTPHILYSSPKN